MVREMRIIRVVHHNLGFWDIQREVIGHDACFLPLPTQWEGLVGPPLPIFARVTCGVSESLEPRYLLYVNNFGGNFLDGSEPGNHQKASKDNQTDQQPKIALLSESLSVLTALHQFRIPSNQTVRPMHLSLQDRNLLWQLLADLLLTQVLKSSADKMAQDPTQVHPVDL